jgi:S1-C subfamily serine protease
MIGLLLTTLVIAAWFITGLVYDHPDPQPAVEPNFTDLVQTSLKGVVHLQASSRQGSGFVVGPRHIVTAWHVVNDIEDVLITTHDGHQVRANRVHSNKDNDVAHIWIDDLTCIAGDCERVGWVGGTEERSFVLGEHKVVLTPLRLGSIKDCVLGQRVYSIGSTLGKRHFNAVATGIIQTLNLDLENFGCSPDYRWAILFSNTAEGGGGNSGCPLFTLDGKIIGVWVGSRQPNVHYCIPVDVFVKDISMISLLFAMDRYEREVVGQSWEDNLYDVYEAWPGFD